jgi:DNA repair exonuclease SbcCD nuclease subunit
MLAKNFLIGLSNECDIIIFRGNHDQTSRSNSESLDYLFPNVYKLETKNSVHILEKTGAYIYGNIIFGYTDIYDNHVFHIENSDEYTKKIKIGLWHGTIHGSVNDNNIDVSIHAKFKQEDFNEYDYVLLGDIHKHQYLNKKKTIAYCGSLIQQNYGETCENHGILKWNLKKKNSKFISIENDSGFVTINIQNDEKPNILDLPSNANIRIIHKNCTQDFIKLIHNEINENTNIVSYVEQQERQEIKFSDSNEEKIEIQNDDTTINRLLSYIKDNYTYTNDECEEFKKIIQKILDEVKYNYDMNKRNIEIKNMSIDNFNVYGEGNFIDYEKMNGIVNICGKNGIGKSSIAVYALMFAIYGKYDKKVNKD